MCDHFWISKNENVHYLECNEMKYPVIKYIQIDDVVSTLVIVNQSVMLRLVGSHESNKKTKTTSR